MNNPGMRVAWGVADDDAVFLASRCRVFVLLDRPHNFGQH